MIAPVGEALLVQVLETPDDDGIIVPTKDQKGNTPLMGRVIKSGSKKAGPGEVVFFKGYNSYDIEYKGEKYLLVDHEDILAKEIKDEK